MRITDDKGIAIANQSTNIVTAIEMLKCIFQNGRNGHVARIGGIILHNKMMNHFHHRSQVALLLKITRVDINEVEKLFRVHQVEITCQCKIPCRNDIAFDEGMTEFHIVLALRTIAKMTKQQLSHEVEMPFHQTRVLSYVGL